MDNEFNALCRLASAEGWCWNLACTTCGHLHFRYAFVELALGKNPVDRNWIVRARQTRYQDSIGSFPRNYSEIQKEKVLNICADADIGQIALSCKFPDWLGYLGLILAHMKMENEAYIQLSQKWASQLKDLVMTGTSTWDQLDEISSGKYSLTLDNLKSVESNYHSGGA